MTMEVYSTPSVKPSECGRKAVLCTTRFLLPVKHSGHRELQEYNRGQDRCKAHVSPTFHCVVRFF